MVHELMARAQDAERAGHAAEARQLYEHALFQHRAGGSGATAAKLLRWVGKTHRAEGDLTAALDCFAASEAVARACGDRAAIAHARNWAGIAYQEWGDLERAEAEYEAARGLAEAASESALLAMVDQNLGTIANIRGALDTALACYRRALARYRQLGEPSLIANVLNDLGLLYTDLARRQEAEAALREASEICERLGESGIRAMVHINLTRLLYEYGELDAARSECDLAFAIASESGSRQAVGEIHMWYGKLDHAGGRRDQAVRHLEAAAEAAERLGSRLLAAEVQRELAHVWRSLDDNRRALHALTYSHRLFTELRASRALADVDARLHELEAAFLEVVRRWGESIESKDRYTAGHCERVADYATRLARAVGFDQQTLTWFRMGAFLHDLGKLEVPAAVLNKRGPLTEEERRLMETHVLSGAALIEELGFPWDIVPMIRSHHERWDGTGYPDGLKANAIPLPARILCIADVYDALTTTRPYRPAYTPADALGIMQADVGKVFDPYLLELFTQAFELANAALRARAPRPVFPRRSVELRA